MGRLSIILLLLLFGSRVAAQEVKDIKGSGYVLTQQRLLNDYNSIFVCCQLKATIVQGQYQPVIIETDNNLFPYIKTVVRHQMLKAYIPDTVRIVKYADMNVLVSMPTLKNLRAIQGASINASPQPWAGDSVYLYVTTGGHIKLHIYAKYLQLIAKTSAVIELKGEVKNLDLDLTTTARLYARELKTENATVELATGAKAEIRVENTLYYNLVGNAKLYLKGRPQVKKAGLYSGSKIIYER